MSGDPSREIVSDYTRLRSFWAFSQITNTP